jgi:hypothetical protein
MIIGQFLSTHPEGPGLKVTYFPLVPNMLHNQLKRLGRAAVIKVSTVYLHLVMQDRGLTIQKWT